MKYDFITIGGAVVDQLLYTKEGVVVENKQDQSKPKLFGFEYGGKVLIDQAEDSFGGGAANSAVGLARLGFTVACLASVGRDDRGSQVISNFKANKVKTTLIQKQKGRTTGFSVVIAGRDREHVAFTSRGANHYLEIGKSEIKELLKAKWLYLTSLSGDWQTRLADIYTIAGSVKIAWNPGTAQLKSGLKLLKGYLANTDLLILNKDEALELLLSNAKLRKLSKTYLGKIENLASELKKYGPEMVLITDGANGAAVLTNDGLYKFKPSKIKDVLNTIGMGDAFGSSFMAGLELFAGDINKSLKLAGINSHRVALSHGAQPGLITKKSLYEII